MDLKPQQFMKLGGGGLLFIGAILDWYGVGSFGFRGIDVETSGLQGVFALLVGLAVVSVTAIAAFAPQVNVPKKIGTIPVDQLLFMLSAGIFVMCFGGIFFGAGAFGPKIGLHFCWIGAGVATAGYFIDRSATSAST